MLSPTATPSVTPTPIEEIAAALERLASLAALTHEERLWLARNGEEVVAEPGEVLFEENSPADRMVIMLHGDVHVYRERGGLAAMSIGRVQQLTGLLPFSRMKNYGGRGVAASRIWTLQIPKSLFPEMLKAIPAMAQITISIMLDRVREVTRIEQQAEKLTALGKLAGNLAHELNNPASAAQRAAANLVGELQANRENRFRLVNLSLNLEQMQRMLAWEERILKRVPGGSAADAAALIALEETIQEWLIALPSEAAVDMAPTLAEHGVTIAELDELTTFLPRIGINVALQFFVRYLRSRQSVNTLLHSTARIFDLISAIKDYSNMDRAPIQEVDVPAGLDATVLMLQSRMGNVTVTREYADDLPCINAYHGELNQVWTELIENALDAMEGIGQPGKLRLVCRMEGALMTVEIHDNGRGISREIRDRIFEPFFTTKAPGQGLGLGLDNAMRIVHMHKGTLDVRSEPGDTCFQVRLPMDQFQAY